MNLRVGIGTKLAIIAEWPTKRADEGRLVIEDSATVQLKPEEVPGAVKVMELLNTLLVPSDWGWTAGYAFPILRGLRLTGGRDGWKLTTEGYLAAIQEQDAAEQKAEGDLHA